MEERFTNITTIMKGNVKADPPKEYLACECGGEWFTPMLRIPMGSLNTFTAFLEQKYKCVSCGKEQKVVL